MASLSELYQNPAIQNGTTSFEVQQAVSDETGTGFLVFNNNPTIVSPSLSGAPTSTTPNLSDNSTRIATTNYVIQRVNQSVAVGSIHFFPSISTPNGYLKLEGQLVSRTTYAELWTFAQNSNNILSDAGWIKGAFSLGNGTTNFRLPDYRGQFLRVYDPTQTIDIDRNNIWEEQGDEFKSHTHTAALVGESAGGTFAGGNGGNDGTGTTNPTGGTETRPKNLAIVACIYTGVI